MFEKLDPMRIWSAPISDIDILLNSPCRWKLTWSLVSEWNQRGARGYYKIEPMVGPIWEVLTVVGGHVGHAEQALGEQELSLLQLHLLDDLLLLHLQLLQLGGHLLGVALLAARVLLLHELWLLQDVHLELLVELLHHLLLQLLLRLKQGDNQRVTEVVH